MSEFRRAIYPGTFDPITNGHLDVVSRASDIFDEVIVAVGTAGSKTPLFSETERKELALASVAEMFPDRRNIKVDSLSGLLVEYARGKDARFIVRGLRALSDFEYEMQMALMNRKLSDIATVFLMPHEKYTYVNSTLIRDIAKNRGDVSNFVTKAVHTALQKKFTK